MNDSEIDRAFLALLEAHDDRREALHAAWQRLENAGLISKVTVQQYRCRRRGCTLMTVIKVGGLTLARSADYKFSRGLNGERSVAAARAKNTLDGDRHWPGHTFDVEELAGWGETAGMDANCRCATRVLMAQRILEDSAGATSGRPAKPVIL